MFAKLQKIRTARGTARIAAHGAAQPFAAAATPCNDNAPVRRAGTLPRRARRAALACRWYRTPAGGLACGWHIASSEEPQTGHPAARRVSRVTGGAAVAALLLL
jgi:hypothetical protein